MNMLKRVSLWQHVRDTWPMEHKALLILIDVIFTIKIIGNGFFFVPQLIVVDSPTIIWRKCFFNR